MNDYDELLEREDRAVAQLWEEEEEDRAESMEVDREEEGKEGEGGGVALTAETVFLMDDHDDIVERKDDEAESTEGREEEEGEEEDEGEEEGGVALAGGTGPRETEDLPTAIYKENFPAKVMDFDTTMSEAAAEAEVEEECKTTTSDILEGFREAQGLRHAEETEFLESEDRALASLIEWQSEREGTNEDRDDEVGTESDGETRQYLGARKRLPGRDPKPLGQHLTRKLPRNPQAIANEGTWERPPLAPNQHIQSTTEIMNPRRNPLAKPTLRREKKRKRRSTTREERIEALQLLDCGEEWDVNEEGEMVLKGPGQMSYQRVGEILGFNESQIRRWDHERKKVLDAPRGTRKIGSGRAVQWPALEERLSHLWLERVGEGLEVSRRWFERHALEIFDSEYPEDVKEVDGEIVRTFK
jgi:hypothetical protein